MRIASVKYGIICGMERQGAESERQVLKCRTAFSDMWLVDLVRSSAAGLETRVLCRECIGDIRHDV